jgi:hypothetical protein
MQFVFSRPSSESRRFRRVPVELLARISRIDALREPDGSAFYSVIAARTNDISDQGLSLRSVESVEQGARVLVELDLPDGRSVAMTGRVVWIKDEGTRITHFAVELSEPHLGLLEASDARESELRSAPRRRMMASRRQRPRSPRNYR